MSAENDFGEKTEEATPEKRQRARDEGQMARSRDGGAVAATGAVLVLILASGHTLLNVATSFATNSFQNFRAIAVSDPSGILKEFGVGVASLTIPIALAAAIGGLAGGVLEAGFNPRLELAAPKFERLDPTGKLKQLFSLKQGGINALLALLRVGVVSAVAYGVLKSKLPGLERLACTELTSGLRFVGNVMLRVAVGSFLALVSLSLLDYGQSWWRLQRELMMSRQELKEELRQQEGDPKVRARIRARARELAKRGLAKEVKRSDVIVANPTHISVALRYRPAEGAPIVTAKGYDEIALFMRKIAKENDIAIVENRPLARALADQTRVGKMIPIELYQAVARVLAIVYRLKRSRWQG
jgi:flagellar biosynthetic protein FlhB